MITDFKAFGLEHIISIIIPILIGLLFLFLSKKYDSKKNTISMVFAVTIILIRSVRYVFDINIGVFNILDLLSLHVCNIDLILLIICLIKPSKKIFTFNFLIGIPTALAVALLPGKVHPDPGTIRAMFFIMSHMMLVIGAIYLKITYKFELTKKDLLNYYMFSFVGIILMYVFNVITKSNYMYLIEAPSKTVLEFLQNIGGNILYVVFIYLILITLITIFYFISKIKKTNDKY